MKKISFNIFVFAAALMLMTTGCKKDSGIVTLSLQTEKYTSQEKTHIETANGVSYTCWDNGDQIKINGTTTEVSGSSVSVTQAENYYAVYPASCVNGDAVTASTSITLPAVYEYTVSSGHQVLGAPMAAKAVEGESGQILFFKNLCTLLKIHVTNNVTVHNINIHSENTNLSGTATVTIGDNGNISLGSVSGNKYVSLYFPEGQYTGASAGMDFYIPVPALAAPETLYVGVVATVGGQKGVYLRGAPVTASLPANLVIPMNIFPTIGSYNVASIVTYLAGNRQGTGSGYQRPYFDSRVEANNTTRIYTSLETMNAGGLVLPTAPTAEFLYGINVDVSQSAVFYLWNAPMSGTNDLVQTGRGRIQPSTFAASSTDRIVISHTPSELVIKNETTGDRSVTAISTPSSYSNSSIWVFGAKNDANKRYYLGKMHYFNIKDASGWRFHGIPTKVTVANWDSKLSLYGLTHGITAGSGFVPCMYDYVSGEFFSSEETTGGGVHFKYGSVGSGIEEVHFE